MPLRPSGVGAAAPGTVRDKRHVRENRTTEGRVVSGAASPGRSICASGRVFTSSRIAPVPMEETRMSWKTLFAGRNRGGGRRRVPRHRQVRPQLELERLEDRTLLSANFFGAQGKV